MSKRGGKKPKSTPDSGPPFSNNPFASVAELGADVPSAPSQEPEAPKAGEPDPEPRFPNKLVVRMEKKGRRGKTVTRISGIPDAELAPLCKEMKKALGCGATIEDSDLVLLGDLVPRAAAWLEKSGATKIVRGT